MATLEEVKNNHRELVEELLTDVRNAQTCLDAVKKFYDDSFFGGDIVRAVEASELDVVLEDVAVNASDSVDDVEEQLADAVAEMQDDERVAFYERDSRETAIAIEDISRAVVKLHTLIEETLVNAESHAKLIRSSWPD